MTTDLEEYDYSYLEDTFIEEENAEEVHIGHEKLTPEPEPKRQGNFKILIPVFLIITAEMLLFLEYTYYSILLHVMTVIWLAISTSSLDDPRVKNSQQALILLPILRLLNMSMPVFFDMTLYSFVIVYVPMLISLHLIIKHQKFTRKQLGIVFKKLPIYVPLALILSAVISHAEYMVISPEYLIPDLSFMNLFGLLIVMVFFVGFIEELIFRSVLQTRLEESFGRFPGLLVTSILFGVMHSGYRNPNEILLTALIGLLLGFLFQKTKSLPLVTMTHGFTNVLLFGVIPHLGLGLGLINM